jgi:CIC family chloride channel protein
MEAADQGRAPQRDEDEDRTGLVRLALAGLAVGALAGLVGSAFHIVLDHADVLRGAVLAWSHAHPWIGWVVPVGLAAAAAFVARWLVARFAPEASGSGVQYVEAVIRGDARSISAAVLPVKFVGGALAIGAGLALGREGPTVQMGATLGHLLARGLRLRPADARVLLAAGAGAGLAAAFNAPLAGAIFVFEELLRRFELRAAVATLAACSGGLAVMRAIVGNRNVFSVPPLEVDLFPGYLLFFAFGGLIGLLGLAYSRAVVGALDLVERFGRVAPAARAAAVGAIVGLVAFLAPWVVGGGEVLVQEALDGRHTIAILLFVFVVRFALGPLSYAPGVPGGLFAPLLVVGVVAGALFGRAAEAAWPALTTPTAAFAAVGMGALFAAVVRAPVTGIALVVEMTGATALFVPLLTACAAAIAVPAVLGERPIYDTLRDRDAARRPGRAK